MNYVEYKGFDRFCRTFELSFIENGFFCGDNWDHENLTAPYNRLYIVLDGEGFVESEYGTVRLEKGHAYIIPANTNFNSSSPVYLKKLYTHFVVQESFYRNVFENVNGILEMKVETGIYEQCLESLEEADYAGYYRVKRQYTDLIYRFIEGLDDEMRLMDDFLLSETLHRIHKWVNDHLDAGMRISDLAKDIGISHSALSRKYRDETGHTLKSYIKDQLIRKAQILLLTTRKSIQEIADDLGYEDALYFSRVFSKWSGDSPSQYRKKNRVG